MMEMFRVNEPLQRLIFFYFFKICVHHGTCVEIRGQLVCVSSLFPPCGTWGLTSGHQASNLGHHADST